MNRFGKLLLTALFLTYIFIIGIYMAISPEYETSAVEKRTLAQRPDFNKEGILSGSYAEDFEAYFTDQFPGRNVWLNAYIHYQRLTGQTYVYNYYITDDNWIMPKPINKKPKDKINTSTNSVNEFGKVLQEKDIEFYYFMTPSKASVLEFLYPDYIQEESGDEENQKYFMTKLNGDYVTAVNMVPAFESNPKEELLERYYQTDHHWNMKGAFEGYKLFLETLSKHSNHFQLNEVFLDEKSYEKVCAPESKTFTGSYNVQIYMSVESNDDKRMCALLPRNISDYEVTVDGERKNPGEIYGRALHSNNDEVSYGQLFTNDLGEITIKNEKNKDVGNILIVKDSYVNPIIFHIAQNFYKTTIYDPRHNKERTVLEYIEENDFDIVAVLYNSTNLAGEAYEFGSDE